MRSSGRIRSPALRRCLPWALYSAAFAAVIVLAWTASGLGATPAVAEARRVTLGCPRTPHRLWVKEVLVSPGQAVVAGQVLARMDPGEMDLELAIARRKVEQLELATLMAGHRLAFESERTSVDLGKLAAEEQHDRSELAQIETTIDQEAALVSDRLTDFERLNELKRRRAGLLGRTRELKLAVAQARRGTSAASDRLSQWRNASGAGPKPAPSRPSDPTAPARAAAEAQRDHVRSLEALREKLELKAPFAGRVDAVLLRPGEIASDDGAVVTVVEERPDSAIAYVDERWATRIHVGDRARLSPRDRSGPPVHGRIAALGPSISELPARFWLIPSQRRYGRAVYVRLDEPAFLPGQTLEVTFFPSRGGGR